jgi:uncharacterized protein (DUF2147 family)
MLTVRSGNGADVLSSPKERAMKRVLMVVLVSALAGAGTLLAADSIVGPWKTVDEKSGKVVSEVELYDQGGKLYGKITRLTEPNDAQGKPKICTKCPGADKDQPIVGLVILKDLGASGDRYKGGTIMDPDNGKVYTAEVWPEDGKLKVRGYLGPFYRTQTWLKGN